MWAILGGSGFERFDAFKVEEELVVKTPFGSPSAAIVKATLHGIPILFLSRHGKQHELCPSSINYRANIYALKSLGTSKILSLSAVGSLQKDLKPGECVIPTQYINWTKLPRPHTFCIEGAVGHVSLAQPVDLALVKQVQEILQDCDCQIHFGKTYICIEGPAFSTQAESKMFRQLGADIIGMTNFPEYALAKEAGMYYLPLSFVTDYDAWDDSLGHVTLEQVLEIMRQNNHKAFALMERLIPQTQCFYPHGCPEQGLKTGLMTPVSALNPDIQAWMKIVCQ